MTADYKAINIQVLKGLKTIREHYDLKGLLEESKRYKSTTEFSKHIHIEERSLGRALQEAKIIQKWPNMHRSKAEPLNHFKIERERNLFSQRLISIIRNFIPVKEMLYKTGEKNVRY